MDENNNFYKCWIDDDILFSLILYINIFKLILINNYFLFLIFKQDISKINLNHLIYFYLGIPNYKIKVWLVLLIKKQIKAKQI